MRSMPSPRRTTRDPAVERVIGTPRFRPTAAARPRLYRAWLQLLAPASSSTGPRWLAQAWRRMRHALFARVPAFAARGAAH